MSCARRDFCCRCRGLSFCCDVECLKLPPRKVVCLLFFQCIVHRNCSWWKLQVTRDLISFLSFNQKSRKLARKAVRSMCMLRFLNWCLLHGFRLSRHLSCRTSALETANPLGAHINPTTHTTKYSLFVVSTHSVVSTDALLCLGCPPFL